MRQPDQGVNRAFALVVRPPQSQHIGVGVGSEGERLVFPDPMGISSSRG